MDFECPNCVRSFSVDSIPIIHSCTNCEKIYLLAFQACFRRFDTKNKSCNIKKLTGCHTNQSLISQCENHTNLLPDCSCHIGITSFVHSIQFSEQRMVSFYQVYEYTNKAVYHGTSPGVAERIISSNKLLSANHEDNNYSIHSLPLEKNLIYLGLNRGIALEHSNGSILEFNISGWVIETNSFSVINQFLNYTFFESLQNLVLGVKTLEGGGTLVSWMEMDFPGTLIRHSPID